MDDAVKISRETGYLICYNDVHKILLDMVTDKNREFLIEFSDRLQFDLEVRKLTEFLPNESFFK